MAHRLIKSRQDPPLTLPQHVYHHTTDSVTSMAMIPSPKHVWSAIHDHGHGDQWEFSWRVFIDDSSHDTNISMSWRHPLEYAHTERFLANDLRRRVQAEPAEESRILTTEVERGRGANDLSHDHSSLQVPSSLQKIDRKSKTLRLLYSSRSHLVAHESRPNFECTNINSKDANEKLTGTCFGVIQRLATSK